MTRKTRARDTVRPAHRVSLQERGAQLLVSGEMEVPEQKHDETEPSLV